MKKLAKLALLIKKSMSYRRRKWKKQAGQLSEDEAFDEGSGRPGARVRKKSVWKPNPICPTVSIISWRGNTGMKILQSWQNHDLLSSNTAVFRYLL